MLQRTLATWVLLFVSVVTGQAQDQASASAVCNFDDDRQVTVRYDDQAPSRKLQNGKIWSPGKSPMFLFTSAPLKIGSAEIPVGAYSLYAIPGKDQWTLVVNKDVSPNAAYNQQQDLARAPMGIGQLSQPSKTANVYLGHGAPKQCNMRIYYGDTGAFVEFDEQ